MAIRNIAHAIQAGEISLGLAVGVESMSMKWVAHFLLSKQLCLTTFSPRPTPEVVESISANTHAHDCMEVMNHFFDFGILLIPENQPMGWTSEMVAQVYKVTRERQDSIAFLSHSRASKVSGHLAHQCPYKLRNFVHTGCRWGEVRRRNYSHRTSRRCCLERWHYKAWSDSWRTCNPETRVSQLGRINNHCW